MQRTQNKKNEILLCTARKCEKPQTADGEYCDKHHPKVKAIFTMAEFDLLFSALICYATEVYEASTGVHNDKDDIKEARATQKAISKLEKKLATL